MGCWACRREAFLPVGSAGGWASKMVWALPSPVVVDDQIWIFYVGAYAMARMLEAANSHIFFSRASMLPTA